MQSVVLGVRAYSVQEKSESSDEFGDCGDSDFGNMGDVEGIITNGF